MYTYLDDTSNIAESENWSMMPVRQAVSPYHALHVLLLRARDKYEEHRAAAEACTTFAVPSAIDHCAKALQYSRDLNPKFVVKSKRDGRVDVYPNPAKPRHYSVDLSLRHREIDVTCSCEKPQKTHDLCWHAVAAASLLKKDPTRFVFREDRTSTWKAQRKFFSTNRWQRTLRRMRTWQRNLPELRIRNETRFRGAFSHRAAKNAS